MKLPSFKRLFKTDFKAEYQELVEQLSFTINSGIESLYDLANGKISIRGNIQCTVRDIDVSVSADGKPVSSTGMNVDGTGRVEGLQVIRVDNLSSPSQLLTGSPFILFTPTQTGVIFNQITGLQAGVKYRIRVIAWQS